MLYDCGLSYSSINTARSMLSSFLQTDTTLTFGQFPLVKRFMKGIFELRPALPRYKSTWDLSTVLNYFRSGPVVDKLSLKDLTLKLCFLLSLLSGQRCQTIQLLRTDKMELSDEKCTFYVIDKVKQTREGTHVAPLVFLAFQDEKLCVIKHINEYMKRTSGLRSDSHTQLLISYVKPYGPVSRDTVSRWCKVVLSLAGIDVSIFKAHSTRSAASSFLAEKNVCLKDIMLSAGWSNESTFQRFYHKPIVSTFNYGDAILSSLNSE